MLMLPPRSHQIVIPGDDESEENEPVTSIHSYSEGWKDTNEVAFSLIIGTSRAENDLIDEEVASPNVAPATSGARSRKAKADRGEVTLESANFPHVQRRADPSRGF